MDTELRPARGVAPGEILGDELEERGWTQRDLAKIMGRPPQMINEIVRGTKQITPETAMDLSRALGTTPELWLNLESNYRLFLASKHAPDKNAIERRGRLYNLAPVAELIKRGWIRGTNNLDDLELAICAFLGIDSPMQTPQSAVNFRHTANVNYDSAAQLAWVKRVEHLAHAQKVGLFDPDRLASNIPFVLEYVGDGDDLRELPELLFDLGVHFVIVPHLSRTFLDGAALRSELNPIVALTLRYDRIDSFWFTLLHELAHIVLGHDGSFLDSLDDIYDQDVTGLEQEANERACDWLISPDAFVTFIEQQSPHFTRAAIEEFATQQCTHPGIVLGQLQHRKLVAYNQHRALLTKVKPSLAAWIDVARPSSPLARTWTG